jgi:hypothetical protein
MLEDHKFYYGVGNSQSPWKPIDKVDTVTMVTEDPYVGVHERQYGRIARGEIAG